MDIKIATDAELNAEIKRREEIASQAARVAWQRRLDTVWSIRDSLLLLAPEHSRTSCSDDRRINDHRGCVRCVLLSHSMDHSIGLTVVEAPLDR